MLDKMSHMMEVFMSKLQGHPQPQHPQGPPPGAATRPSNVADTVQKLRPLLAQTHRGYGDLSPGQMRLAALVMTMLPELPLGQTRANVTDGKGNVIATAYNRIVFGGGGAYFEFDEVSWQTAKASGGLPSEQKFYVLFKVGDTGTPLYLQLATVDSVTTPPHNATFGTGERFAKAQ